MFKNRYVFISILVLVILVCNTLYWLFPFRPMVWRISLVLIALFLIVDERKRLPSEKAVIIFAGFVFFHFLLSFLWMTPTMTMIGNALCNLLSLSLFTCLSEKGVLSDKYIAVAALALVIVAVPYYYHIRLEMLDKVGADVDADITNNASSIFLMLLPIVFLLKNSIQRWATLLVCLFFIILSAKRGNILAAVLPSILFAYSSLKGGKHSVFKTLAVTAAIIVVGYFLYRWTINNDYLMYRLEQTAEGDTSNRNIIYAGAWNAWSSASSLLTLLFGYGYEGTSAIVHIGSAHSDWLEILVDYGLLGVVLYFIIFYCFYKQILKTNNFEIRVAMLAAVLIWFFKSVYSMGLTALDMPILMITLGTALGRFKLENVRR